MRIETVLLILGMALVTYIPRVLPALFTERMKFGKKAESFLKLIPYTAMAALIFPGVFTVDSASPVVGIAGGAVAILLAWFKLPLIVSVMGAIGVDLLIYAFLL